MDFKTLKIEVEKKIPELIEIRRKIHMNPERGMEEFKTTSLIVETLKSFGISEVQKIKDTGVVAVIRGKGEKCIAIRADIDALKIAENTNLEFSSKNGFMHACGHDIHTTSLIGAAYFLNLHRNELKGIVKLIFQPAEEQGVGAKYMIENGALKDPKPEAIFALHAWPGIEANKVFHRHGKMGASSDKFEIKVIGEAGHVAHPQKTVDSILIAGNIITAIQAIVSRELSPMEQAVISFASIHGGDIGNKIPKEVILKGSIRTLSEETRTYVHKRVVEISKNIATTFRGRAEVVIKTGAPVSYNENRVSKLIEKACKEALGEENYIENPNPTLGSEDFAYYSEDIPSAMYRLGVGFKNKKNAPLHSDKFIANEDAIKTGVISMVAVADKLLNEFK